jgi:hypothetical protein
MEFTLEQSEEFRMTLSYVICPLINDGKEIE